MEPGSLAPYEHSLASGDALSLRHEDGRVARLDIDRWLAPADADDLRALEWARSPVLDVGCGPGRMLRAAAGAGLFAVGVDIARTAVRLSRAGGGNALRRDVFGPMPGAARWATILLLDGNIGIGGDPQRLLARCGELLRDDGRVVVETDPDPSADERGHVQFTTHGTPVGPPFRWAVCGVDALRAAATAAGFAVEASRTAGARAFTVLTVAGVRVP